MFLRRLAKGRCSVVLISICMLVFTMEASAKVLCRFAVIGDVRPKKKAIDRITPNPIFLRSIEAINHSGSDFTVITGDLIYGSASIPFYDSLAWSAFKSACKKFTKPVRLVLGNHDACDSQSLAYFEKQFGPARYAFEHKGAYFIVLNTEELRCRTGNKKKGPSLEADQINWLARELKLAGTRPTFIFLHSPLWRPNGRIQSQNPTTQPTNTFWAKQIHPLLVQAGNVQAVIGGHEHLYHHEQYDGIQYIISGGGGAEFHGKGGPSAGLIHHFLTIAVDPDRKKTKIDLVSLESTPAGASSTKPSVFVKDPPSALGKERLHSVDTPSSNVAERSGDRGHATSAAK